MKKKATPRRAAVLLIVLIAMMFATAALVLFIERATPDLLVEKREASARWLRREAENALEAALAVLVQYEKELGGFHHPDEGWGDPLALTDYRPGEGRKVKVVVTDESGRIPLVNTDFTRLSTLLRAWGASQGQAEKAADAFLAWTKKDYVPRVLLGFEQEDYRRGKLRYRPPQRPLRSWAELGAIAVVRDLCFEPDGQLSEIGRRWVSTFSLLEYDAVNLNSAVPDFFTDTLGLGGSTRLGGAKAWTQGQGFFRTREEAVARLGPQLPAEGYGVKAQALRVLAVVTEGDSTYQLSVLLGTSDGARWPQGEVAPDPEAPTATREAQDAPVEAPTQKPKYPFAILEISEKDGVALPSELLADSSAP